MLQFSIAILCYLEGEIDYRPFILFVECCSQIMYKKFLVNTTAGARIRGALVNSKTGLVASKQSNIPYQSHEIRIERWKARITIL